MRLLLRILGDLRLIVWCLSSISSGCDGSNVLVVWIVLSRPPMGHHTDFLILFPRKVIPEFLGSTG